MKAFFPIYTTEYSLERKGYILSRLFVSSDGRDWGYEPMNDIVYTSEIEAKIEAHKLNKELGEEGHILITIAD